MFRFFNRKDFILYLPKEKKDDHEISSVVYSVTITIVIALWIWVFSTIPSDTLPPCTDIDGVKTIALIALTIPVPLLYHAIDYLADLTTFGDASEAGAKKKTKRLKRSLIFFNVSITLIMFSMCLLFGQYLVNHNVSWYWLGVLGLAWFISVFKFLDDIITVHQAQVKTHSRR